MVFFMDITSFRLGFVSPGMRILTSGEKADAGIPWTGESAPLHEPPRRAQQGASKDHLSFSVTGDGGKTLMLLQDRLKR